MSATRITVAAVALLATVPVATRVAAAASDACGPPVTSVIACENSLPGDPAGDWQVAAGGDPAIQGFATSMSVNVGQTVSFKIKSTTVTSYHVDILRLGYYQGDGARKVASALRPTAALPQTQPACLTDATTGLIDCGNWSVSASWSVPSTAVSGLYLAHLVRDDNGSGSEIPFVVRNDASHSEMVVQTSDETWQAYNTYGGNSLYSCTVACPPGNPGGYKAAYKVSYNRPISGTDDGGRSWYSYAELPMIRFLERNGYDVSYTSGSDVATRGSLLLNHKAFLSVGHDEYWSGDQRANVEAARDAGVNLAFFSGNEVYWKTRWENSTDASHTNDRTLVTYKETHFDAQVDPAGPSTWTGTWGDMRFSPPGDAKPQNALTGQFFLVNDDNADIAVPSQYAKLRFWRNTGVAALAAGQSVTLGAGIGTLGYEWDEDADNGYRPAGLIDMSSTSDTPQVFVDYGTNVTTGPATHHLTLYRAASGALVFGAGTVQWSWGLDSENPSHLTDTNMQQATVNLFADMGVQPASLDSDLQKATASTDTTPPSSTITSPASGAGVSDGSSVTVTGAASDSGGSVAGVEVSTDGGQSWHPANGTSSWTYTWVAHGNPVTTIMSRATDDSGNIETSTPSRQVNVTCPCSVFGVATAPTGLGSAADSGDPAAVEVGMKFRADTAGAVRALRFYKASTNTGTHVGHLWTAAGQLLATATFSNETTSGWQQVNLSTPVTLAPGTTYVVSYSAPAGHYSASGGYFYGHPSPEPDGNDSVDASPLHALRNVNGTTNGVFAYGADSFPSNSFNAANYWVDVVFSPTGLPSAPSGLAAAAGDGSVRLGWAQPADDGGSTNTYNVYRSTSAGTPGQRIANRVVATSYTDTAVTNGTSYYYEVSAVNDVGEGRASNQMPAAPAAAVKPSPSVTPTPKIDPTPAPPASVPPIQPSSGPAPATTPPLPPASPDNEGPATSSSDHTAPSVLVTRPGALVQLSRQITARFTGTDTGSGVASYDVRYRAADWNRGFGGFVYPAMWQRTRSTVVSLHGSHGVGYCFSVRARDGAGNTSRWSAERCTVIPLDDRSLSTATSHWTRMTSASAYSGTLMRTTTAGSQLRLAGAHVRRLALVVTECAHCGSVAIYVNGKYWRTVSTHSATTRTHWVIVEPLFSLRTATIVLKSTTRSPVLIDGIAIAQQ